MPTMKPWFKMKQVLNAVSFHYAADHGIAEEREATLFPCGRHPLQSVEKNLKKSWKQRHSKLYRYTIHR